MQKKKVLEAWILIESMNSPEIGKSKNLELKIAENDKKKIKSIVGIQKNELPWEEPYQLADNKEIEYTCFLGVYEMFHVAKITREYFKNNEELFNLDKKKTYVANIKLDKDGEYIEDSLYLPFISYVLGKMQAKKEIDFSTINTEFQELETTIQEKASEIFVNGVTEESITLFEKLIKKKLGLNTKELQGNYLDSLYVQYHIKSKDEESQFDTLFNSFYIEDSQNIVGKQNYPSALKQYLEGIPEQKRQVIDENHECISSILEPKNIPIARWPSPVAHRLSLMQQVSVNLALGPTAKESIRSVNGPPGTGKTTLLKDIFANLVTERALKMCELKNPINAFAHDKIDIGGESHNYFTLLDGIKGYSMVVASSNNTAVENISKELPTKGEIIRNPKTKDANENDYLANFEREYARLANDLDLFRKSASLLKEGKSEPDENSGNDAWGLFSVALGKKDNLDKFKDSLLSNQVFLNQLKAEKYTLDDWKKEKAELKRLASEIESEKAALQQFCSAHKTHQQNSLKLQELEGELEAETETMNKLKQVLKEIIFSKADYKEKLVYEPKVNAVVAFFLPRKKEQAKRREETLTALSNLKQSEIGKRKEITAQENKQDYIKTKIEDLQRQSAIYHKLRAQFEDENIVIPDEVYWEDANYAKRQQNTPWLTDNLLHLRALLFLQAMKVHKVFLCMSHYQILQNVNLFNKRKLIDTNHDLDVFKELWDTIHLFVPVISTTFASVGRMYKELGPGSIDYLFIDEAGQAIPQAAVGAIWRSKHVIAVGDPLQIEPVVTMDKTLLTEIQRFYNLPDEYILPSSSVQSLADRANPYGMYKRNSGNEQWIGIPLWVHRRCLDPMFTISNQMAYENKMVLGKNGEFKPGDSLGISRWIDVKGKAKSRQYVKEQGDEVLHYVRKAIDQNTESEDLPDLYIITPFTEVRNEIRELLRSHLKQRRFEKKKLDHWMKYNIGTVHTFQGKEAQTVLFVCGTDQTQEGAANWICQKPNLLNVAVTRAKERFIIIGDLERLKVKEHFKLLNQHLNMK
ncbi:hypothetical protein KFZ58_14525 [Virgibacillus sp. NKC19-16]|uniref:DEAD/DEAH box helicase n=1 Tax=Virgibacillus salidurans TaxID=2831673 RepID=UPI001F245678|nr:ATP-binding protein [Virgibacillus sp. NKC19-16]UJL45601.1 hypothetical protein KFZ58_14525 [Virgibacillus sp. NKC19-16]